MIYACARTTPPGYKGLVTLRQDKVIIILSSDPSYWERLAWIKDSQPKKSDFDLHKLCVRVVYDRSLGKA